MTDEVPPSGGSLEIGNPGSQERVNGPLQVEVFPLRGDP